MMKNLYLYYLSKSTNPDFPYWKYNAFDLDSLTNDECNANCEFVCYNRTVVNGIEGLCILLKRLAYPCVTFECGTVGEVRKFCTR